MSAMVHYDLPYEYHYAVQVGILHPDFKGIDSLKISLLLYNPHPSLTKHLTECGEGGLCCWDILGIRLEYFD